MGYVLLVLIAAAAVTALVAAQLFLLPVAIVVAMVAGCGHGLVRLGGALVAVFAVRDHGGPSPDPVPPDPAVSYLPYPVRQVWRDLDTVLSGVAVTVARDAYRLHRRAWTGCAERFGRFLLIGIPTIAGLVLGTVLAAVPLLAAALGMALGVLAASALWLAVWLVAVSVLGTLELAVRAVRRVVVACPHPGCYHRFGLPVYACSDPGCHRRHPRLAPGWHGALRHACGCGASLPTLVLLGRHRLTGFCPRCHGPLPGRTGQVRIEHVPVVGGPDAGKTTFLCLAIGALTSAAIARGGTVDYPDHRVEAVWRTALTNLRGGIRLVKTEVTPPAAVMLDIRPRQGAGRILYLFDPAGEYWDSTEMVDTQRYLARAEIALAVVDPLAIPGVWRAFTDEDRRIVAEAAAPNQAQVARENPGDLVDRLTGILRGREGGGRLRRLLLVVSKTDVLRHTSVGRALRGGRDADDRVVRGWLEDVGWGNGVRTLEGCSGEVRYLASGLDLAEERIARLVEWLTGTRPAVIRRPWWAGRPARAPQRRPWRAAGRPGRIPRNHLAGRVAMLVASVPLTVVPAVATAYLLAQWLISVYR